jgi:hypothetical protein
VETQVLRLSEQLVDFWVEWQDSAFLLRYEDFISGRTSDLAEYLGFEVSADVEVDETYSRVARAKRSGDWRRWFSKADAEYYRDVFASFIERFAYDRDLALNGPKIPIEEGERYFVRVVNDGRAKLGVPPYQSSDPIWRVSDFLSKLTHARRRSSQKVSR